VKGLLFILLLISLPTIAESINVELISYEDKSNMFDDTAYCELEFSFTNNSWGTIYGLSIEAESFDDRGDKVSASFIEGNIDAFGGILNDIDKILLGNSVTTKSLNVDSKCKYIERINLIDVKPQNCNIRNMPENANCLAIINPTSSISSIRLMRLSKKSLL